MKTEERDHRLALLDSLLTTPHRKLEEVQKLHRGFLAQDPRFSQQNSVSFAARGSSAAMRPHNVRYNCLCSFPELKRLPVPSLPSTHTPNRENPGTTSSGETC